MNILFCGGGALGSHALCLARNLSAQIAVVDDDRVETKNLPSQWFVKPMVGKNKAAALRAQMLNFYGGSIKDYAVRLTAMNVAELCGGFDLIVECFDNGASRQVVQDYVRAKPVPCVHAGLAADGAFGAVRWDRNFVIDHEPQTGQATCEGGEFLPLIVRTSTAVVDAVSSFMEDGSEQNWNVWPRGAEVIA